MEEQAAVTIGKGSRNSSDDDCPLIHPDTLLDDPVENNVNANGFFRRRQSQAQVPHMTRLQSTISFNSLNAGTPHLEERMRRRLQYFFMNPCQKYQAKRRKPFKLGLQIIKIALVTAQLCLFAEFNMSIAAFKQQNDDIFKRVFVAHNGTIYTKSAVYGRIDNIRKEFAQWSDITVGMFYYLSPDNKIVDTPPPVNMCVSNHVLIKSQRQGNNSIFRYNFKTSVKECFQLKQWDGQTENTTADCIPLTNGSCYHFDFDGLVNITVSFHFFMAQVSVPIGFTSPSCYNTLLNIVFDNSKHSGVMTPSLVSEYHVTKCPGNPPKNSMKIFLNLFDCIIIVTCSLSMVLCVRSLWKAQTLRKKFEVFFRAQYNKQLNFSEKMEFFNMWYLLIVISDFLTILGSVSKMVLQNRYAGIIDYNVCSIFLGVGCLCVWIGVLRYAGFFHKYNILVLTLKKSLPHVCRFMVCASLLYLGFMFCGWAMLGPHHHKFRSLVVTSEALFSLINGDDMYMTYEEMSRKSTMMIVVSQIYLYVFIALFIYVVLSLFIAVIMDTYETIRDWQEGDEPEKNEIEKFMTSCTADACVENFRFELNTPTPCRCCCFSHDDDFLSDEE